jgi:hypothetical protein
VFLNAVWRLSLLSPGGCFPAFSFDRERPYVTLVTQTMDNCQPVETRYTLDGQSQLTTRYVAPCYWDCHRFGNSESRFCCCLRNALAAAVTGRVQASSPSGTNTRILVQFTIYVHGHLLDSALCNQEIYSSTTDANLSVIFWSSSSYCA